MLTKNNWQKAFDMLNEYATVDDEFYGGVCSYKFLSFEGVKKLVEIFKQAHSPCLIVGKHFSNKVGTINAILIPYIGA